MIATVSGIEDANRLADTVASHMTLTIEQKQDVLEVADLTERFEHLMGLMESEIDLFQIEQRIRGRVKKQMEKSQREYYLNEQMKAIQKELGDMMMRAQSSISWKRKLTKSVCQKRHWKKPKSEAEQAENDVADVCGSLSLAQLYRLDDRRALEKAQPS